MAKECKNIEITAKIKEPIPVLTDVTVLNPRPLTSLEQEQIMSSVPAQSKYVKLLRVIEQLGRDLKPFYTGNKLPKTMHKVERDLVKARHLIKQCRIEATRSSKKTCQ